MTAEELEVIRKQAEAAMKAAPGEWECDGIDNEDGHGKFRSYAVYLSDGRSICDTLNSSIIEIEEEADEYGVRAFDRIGAICMEFIAAANPEAVLALLSALDAANRRADEAEARRKCYECGSEMTACAQCNPELVSAELATLRARVAELEAGGCARGQNTTQYCAEAVALQKRVAELEENLVSTAASLAAAISILERGRKNFKKAAPSDKMFDQMLVDYKGSLSSARAALNKEPGNDA